MRLHRSLPFLLALSLVLPFGCGSSRSSTSKGSADASSGGASGSDGAKDSKSVRQVVTAEAAADTGLFNVYVSGDKIYYEIPDTLLGRDMLMLTRVAEVPAGYSGFIASGSEINDVMVRWEKLNDRILLREVAATSIAPDTAAVAISVRSNNFAPVVESFKVEAEGDGGNSSLIDVTDFFLNDQPATAPFSTAQRKDFEIKRFDKNRSYIDAARSYPTNVETRFVLTFVAGSPPGQSAGALSFLMNQSLILLPEKPMMPRLADPRVGWFTVRKLDFGSDEQRVAERHFIRRWRLEPSDWDAYRRGDLVEPVKPIVYYLDPATPEKWRSYVKQGIEDWQRAFELAGFKNAIIAKDPPSPEEDPEFSPEDARYSVVRWVANTVRNAVGPSVIDPRTGEIIESDVIFFHNHLLSYRNMYIVQIGAVDPRARRLQIPDEIVGEMLRAVIAHEVGHALGLPHNMGSSSAYPVDSLRSATFTARNGLSPSIMDYARLNYVAQPGDEGVRLIRTVGPYDHYAINWGYRLLPDVTDPENESATLDAWVLSRQNDPVYRFGDSEGWSAIDPRNQMEDLGDDAVAAGRYGIANLKRVIPNLVAWSTEEFNDYDDLKALYEDVVAHWNVMMLHVAASIGGVYGTVSKPSEGMPVFTVVPEERQRRALRFLIEEGLSDLDWIVDRSLLQRIESAGAVDRVRRMQVGIINRLLDPQRMARLIEADAVYGEEAYDLNEFLDDLRKGVWREIATGASIDVFGRNLQRGWIERMEWLMVQEPEGELDTRVDVSQSDIRPFVRGQLETVQGEIRRAIAGARDPETKLHLKDAEIRIERILHPEK